MYRYPFTPFPNSWYRIASSKEVPVGGIKRVRCLGEDLVVFRGEDRTVCVLDAYCVHLGADLSVGGTVVGNTIACPFHHWRYGSDGACVHIPYCSKIPKKARIRSWPVTERNDAIFFYYHAERDAPSFDMPAGPFRSDAKWNSPLHSRWTIRMHIQEVAENAVDIGHFPVVHAYRTTPMIESFVCDGPRFTVALSAHREGFGIFGPSPMTITYHGFGVVYATIMARVFGRFPVEVAVMLTTTPVDEEHCEIHIMARHRKTWNPLLDWLLRPVMLRDIRSDFSNDIPIWEAKKYLPRPVMCKGDGPIGSIRKWARQFYSPQPMPHSPSRSLP